MVRSVERGAGIAAIVLAALGGALLLFAPVIPVCAGAACNTASIRYVSLLQAGASAGTWFYVLGLGALAVAAGVAAIFDARAEARVAVGVLWIGALLAFAVCALGAAGAGLLYLPAVVAVCLAAYAALQRRLRSRQPTPPDASPDETPPIPPE